MVAKTYHKTVLSISLFLIVLAFSTTAHAKIITVDDDGPADFDNIQAAIDITVDGDIILVAPGIYTGKGNRDIDFKGKAITLCSADSNDHNIVAATIIDCNGNEQEPHRGFYFHSNEGKDAILDGFTITNGYYTEGTLAEGGGIFCIGQNVNPTIKNCIITGNLAHVGGGIACYTANPTIVNCIITNNYAYPHTGGGIHCWDHASPKIIGCFISHNKAKSDAGGVNFYGGSPMLVDCILNVNSALLRGGGVYCRYGEPKIIKCAFAGNFAGESGGGMYNRQNDPILKNCTFFGNSSHVGGAIFNHSGSPVLTNCTFSGNFAEMDGGGIWNYSYTAYCTPVLTNCILWGDKPDEIYRGRPIITYSDVQGGWPGNTNVNVDPRFFFPGYWADVNDPNIVVEPNVPNAIWLEGDYHLRLDSPCIDAGDPNYIAEPNETDLDGNPRVINGRIDMGAYEAPVVAEARFLPRTINLASKGNWITCYIWLPEQYNVADIKPNSIFLEDQIQPDEFSIDEQLQLVTARFAREDVQPILGVGDIDLTITGRLNDGTVFEATDTIKVIDKAVKN